MQNDPTSLWSGACALLAARLAPEAHRRWIAPLVPLDLSNDILTLGVANDFFQSWLQDNYLPLIRAALQEVTGRAINVRFSSSSVTAVVPSPVETSAPPLRDRKPIEADLNPAYTFENFIVGQNSQFAHAAALAVVKEPGTCYNPLFIYGGTGMGKTHLMQAIGSSLMRSGRPRRVVYITA